MRFGNLRLPNRDRDPLKRAFYELECIRGSWSVRELKRQIASLYFERSGLSQNKEKLAARVKAGAETFEPGLAVRDPYVFEFLGLRSREVMGESDLEDALLDRLQDFLLELGHGFCFEARQKRILIGDAHGFVDLVFYHRILKSHVLVELKVAEFSHEHMGQLNTYVGWYKRNMMIVDDNPSVGLCTRTPAPTVFIGFRFSGSRARCTKSRLKPASAVGVPVFPSEVADPPNRVDRSKAIGCVYDGPDRLSQNHPLKQRLETVVNFR